MNKERRDKLQKTITSFLSVITLDDIAQAIVDAQEEEQESFDNLAESLQESERGRAIEAAAAALDEALEAIEEMQANLEMVIIKVEEACR